MGVGKWSDGLRIFMDLEPSSSYGCIRDGHCNASGFNAFGSFTKAINGCAGQVLQEDKYQSRSYWERIRAECLNWLLPRLHVNIIKIVYMSFVY